MKYFQIKNLKRADYNPRIMPDKEMASLMRSIETHGFCEPIVVNINPERYGIIVGGHQRLTAIERLLAKDAVKGLELDKDGFWTIPVFEVDLTFEAEQQLNIGLNKIHGKFDEDKIYELITSMKESPTLMTTGFGEDEISMILDRDLNQIDEEEEGDALPDEPISKPGEIYELGPHRLICGSSTDLETYSRLFEGVRPDMIWTDPPYNVAYKSRGKELQGDGKQSIMNDDMSASDFKKFIDDVFANMLSIAKEGAPFYICSGWGSYPQFLQSMLANGFQHSGVIIWVKNVPSMGWNDYRYKHEWIAKAKKPDPKTAQSIIYGWSQGKHMFYGDNEYDVWEMPRKATARYLHPTEKPDWLIMRAIRNSTKRGDVILDPFSGSGSLLAACEKTGRTAYMIELDPKYCDVIRKRWDKIEKSKIQIHE